MKEIKEWCSRFLESLERHAKEEHVECLYMHAKKVVEDFMRAHKKGVGSSNLRINFISNLVDFGDELFDAMYSVEHEIKCGHVEQKITLKDIGGRRVDCVDWVIHVPPADKTCCSTLAVSNPTSPQPPSTNYQLPTKILHFLLAVLLRIWYTVLRQRGKGSQRPRIKSN